MTAKTNLPPESSVRRNGILGRLTRRWWIGILPLWLVVSIPQLFI